MARVTARILDGSATLASIKLELTDRVARLAERGVVPGLGTVLVGDDPGSHWYVNAKHRDCAQIGITSLRRDLPATATQAEVEAVIDELNADPACTGFLVQQPTGLDELALLSRVDPTKDVDGLHPMNLGWLALGKPAPLPCTPMGCIELLRRFDVPIAGAKVVVIGRGLTVGRPLGLILTRKSENATVTLCHTGTRDLAAEVRRADIVIAAAGVPGIVTRDMVRPGAAVLDVGVSRVEGKIAGDVAPDVARGGRLGQSQPRRCGTDDPGAAALEHRRRRRATPRCCRGDRIARAGLSLAMQWRGSGFVVLSWWWLIATIVAVGVLVIGFADLRWGGRIMAVGFLLGAVIRLVARPARKAGGLNVRSRTLDVVILVTLGVGVLVASATVNLGDPVRRTSVRDHSSLTFRRLIEATYAVRLG